AASRRRSMSSGSQGVAPLRARPTGGGSDGAQERQRSGGRNRTFRRGGPPGRAPLDPVAPEGLAFGLDPGIGLQRNAGAEGGAADQVGTDRNRQDHEQEHEDRLEKLGPAFGEEH